jgi:hypothetical protein
VQRKTIPCRGSRRGGSRPRRQGESLARGPAIPRSTDLGWELDWESTPPPLSQGARGFGLVDREIGSGAARGRAVTQSRNFSIASGRSRSLPCDHMTSATETITIAAGTRISCAIRVPASRLPTSHTTARLKCGSDVLPSITSSVITDICGSTNTNIMMVAVPLTTADKVLEVTRSAGFKYPAYSGAKTPVVQSAIAATLSAMTPGEMPSAVRLGVIFAATCQQAAVRVKLRSCTHFCSLLWWLPPCHAPRQSLSAPSG